MKGLPLIVTAAGVLLAGPAAGIIAFEEIAQRYAQRFEEVALESGVAYSQSANAISGPRIQASLAAISGNIGSNQCLFDAGVARSHTDDARPVLIGLSVRHGR
jgi:hypothetical protein